jgi:hypothetical protein
MTYLFKLARRAARLRALLPAALAFTFGACDGDPLTSVSEVPAPVASADPLSTPPALSFSSGFVGGIPFGTFDQPNSAFGDLYNAALRNDWPENLLSNLAQIKARGGRVVLMFAGNEEHYKDGDGHFSLSEWKARVDRFKVVNFSSYVSDGTIIGHYLIDEPNDPANWNGRPVAPATLEEMAGYSKQLWPTMPTIVRAEPGYLAQWSGSYRHLDAAWAQYLHRRGDAGDYIRRSVSDAKSKGLALIVGLNILKGGPNQSEMTASQLQSWGSTLLADPYPCAFISWKYDEKYLQPLDITKAMASLSQKAREHVSRSCSAEAKDPPIPLPGVGGIVLKATAQVKQGIINTTLTWSGASGSSVEVYRDGKFRKTTANDGRTMNVFRYRGANSYLYQVCETGKSRCSKSTAVRVR